MHQRHYTVAVFKCQLNDCLTCVSFSKVQSSDIDERMNVVRVSAASNVVMPRRPATAMDQVIKENVVQPPVIRPKPLPVIASAGVNDQVGCTLTDIVDCLFPQLRVGRSRQSACLSVCPQRN